MMRCDISRIFNLTVIAMTKIYLGCLEFINGETNKSVIMHSCCKWLIKTGPGFTTKC